VTILIPRNRITVTLIGVGNPASKSGVGRLISSSSTEPFIVTADNLGVVGCDARNAPGGIFRVPFNPALVRQVCSVYIYKSDDGFNKVTVTNGPVDGSGDVFDIAQPNQAFLFVAANGIVMPVGVPPL
jgi:hypothetical protein